MKAPTKRSYVQTARAAASRETEDAILIAFRALLEERWYDELTLDEVAQRAGTTRQTVIRRFGGKAGLLAAFTRHIGKEIAARRAAIRPGDLAGAAAILVADYEATGETVLRLLSLEGRIPEISETLAVGRVGHRRWVELTFAPRLDAFAGDERKLRLSHLLVATDVWTWFLFRRTQGNSPDDTVRLMSAMIAELLD
ncbi:TetR/AcrR family transcriptional regulator [Methylosinus sp. H3A]|uniref:TetR/AcrR family transcriptional regulator n=1 Tax=Methylosinus sp. H3A TaxID=2785786 RepID=UPI0018C33DF5|nr:TetR/AcrR family transcriptional regulator [Methylosinus sp. H3A]MBG0810135.1 TetR/AcrR family transcriptional regulator [Methylosinus sp. H3A]